RDRGDQVYFRSVPGSQSFEFFEAHSVGALIGLSILIDRNFNIRDDLRDRFRQFSDLIVPTIIADVNGQKWASGFHFALNSPIYGSGHVLDVYQRSPWRSITQDGDLFGSDCSGDKIV